MLRSHSLVLAISLVASFAGAAPAAQVLDLGRQPPDASAKVSVPAGEPLSVLIRNRIPAQDYVVSTVRRAIEIPAFPAIGGVGPAGAPGCQELQDEARKLSTQDDESSVANIVDGIEAALEAGLCADPDALATINLALSRTVTMVPGTWVLRGGEELVVTVTRTRQGKTKKWELVLSTGPRGKWLTTYGFATYPNRDQEFFAKSDGAGKFVVTPETEPDTWDLKLVPSIFLTWLPSAKETSDFSFGLSGGLGVKDDAPVVFIGGSVLYNWNLSLVAGLGLAHQWRLKGQYSEEQVLSDNLTQDQLNEKVFRPTWMAAVTFRFGSSPFGDSKTGGGSPASPAPKPSPTPTPKPPSP
jgi:hypothetical protein